jgi:hypothetical protein
VTFDDLINPSLQATASVRVDFKPYAYLEARGFLYHQNIASAGLGTELSLPTRLFYYLGNACGNGAGGSGSETVNGGYINVGAQLEFYRNSTVFWDDHFAWLDSPVSSLGSFFREVEVDQFLRDANEHSALRGELFFTTLQVNGGIHPLTPILSGNASVNMGQTASYTVSKRACVPMDAPLNYVISWGDGTANSVLQAAPGASASATHQFNVFGTQNVKARITGDTAGRSINKETTRSITVNANAVPPMPGSMTVPASDPDGNFSVSWSATVNTVNYRLFRRVNTGSGFGAWSQIDTVTGTSKSLTAQPYGTVQYGVKACNTQGCSDTRTSNSLLVGIIPAAPNLTVTSMLCFGGNDVSWTAPSGATSYKLYWSEGTNPNNAGLLYEGPGRQKAINITNSTNLWVKACGTAGCGAFSAMKTAHRYPVCK